MSRFVKACQRCGHLGPYGFLHQKPDGTYAYLWACEAHSSEVKAAAGLAPAAAAPPPLSPSEPVHVPVPPRPGEFF
ncbi:hypothetical protein [Vineibacter terrae]|uniref:hypothetical protein n=1 Tax=Vineibacter terrae TaxID=2586908 RepID=UPI002E364D0C|nr:hypothetical protein [Vineibacter terrae]HEX2892272.1 hypothetical protein [Vineibacter terrae]